MERQLVRELIYEVLIPDGEEIEVMDTSQPYAYVLLLQVCDLGCADVSVCMLQVPKRHRI
jgi:hypothetical protein